MTTTVTSPLTHHLHSVRSAFREGYSDGRSPYTDSPALRAWRRVAGWREVRNTYAVAVADHVLRDSLTPSLVEVYRLISDRYDCAVERARRAS